jgi:mono/diheme cytochrome c family protein
MPAFKGIVSDAQIHLLTAYVYGLNKSAPGAAPATK